MRKHLTQKQALFYELYLLYKKDNKIYTPIWQLIGEVWCPEVHKWGFVSYEVSARMSELFKGNPRMLERKRIVGKTGAKYYAYRLRLGISILDVEDPKVLSFYKEMVRERKRLTQN